MTLVARLKPVTTDKIYVDRGQPPEEDLKKLKETLNRLASNGGITERDEQLLEYLRELSVLSIDQIHRLMFPQAKLRTAYQRMVTLGKNKLISSARIPRTGMQEWGLPVGKVYSLGVGGRLWLAEEVNSEVIPRHLKRDQVLHDLLVSETCMRLIEAVYRRGQAWSLTWVNERAASFYAHEQDHYPTLMPDGLAVVRRKQAGKSASLPFFLELDSSREAHGRPSSDWGRKIMGYDQFRDNDDQWKRHPHLAGLPNFPLVAVVTHGEQRLHHLAAAIAEKRKNPVIYYMALWEDLAAGDDILKAPAWLIVAPDGQLVGENRADRQPLLAID